MLSNFGSSDGGRETWAYSFIPLLLGLNDKLHLRIFGFTPTGEPDNSDKLMRLARTGETERFVTKFFKVKWPSLPLFFSMFYRLKRYLQDSESDAPQLALAPGGLFEMLMLTYIPKYKNSTKVLWLRGIFCNEKANRVPFFLLPLLKKFEIYIVKKADVLIANGDDIAAYYGQYGLKIHVIKNGVDMSKWSVRDPVMKGPVHVAFIGRLAEAKGIVEFLKMVQMIKSGRNAESFVFSVIGHGPFSDEVESLKEKGALSCHGMVEHNELPKYLENFDVCVALTLAKDVGGGGGTSNALLEQMAAGRVILAWDNAIFRQLLDEQNSYLVKQGDVAALAGSLHEILLDKDRALSKGIAGKQVVSGFSINSQMDKFKKLVPSLIEIGQSNS